MFIVVSPASNIFCSMDRSSRRSKISPRGRTIPVELMHRILRRTLINKCVRGAGKAALIITMDSSAFRTTLPRANGRTSTPLSVSHLRSAICCHLVSASLGHLHFFVLVPFFVPLSWSDFPITLFCTLVFGVAGHQNRQAAHLIGTSPSPAPTWEQSRVTKWGMSRR